MLRSPVPVAYAAALTDLSLMNSNKSALMISAWVVGIPCGNPG